MSLQPGYCSETGEAVDRRQSEILGQASSIRWRLILRKGAHGNLEGENHGVGGIGHDTRKLDETAHQDFLSTRYLPLNDRCPMIIQTIVPFRLARWRLENLYFLFPVMKMIMQRAHMFTESLGRGPISQKQVSVRIQRTTSSHDTGPSTGLEIDRKLQGPGSSSPKTLPHHSSQVSPSVPPQAACLPENPIPRTGVCSEQPPPGLTASKTWYDKFNGSASFPFLLSVGTRPGSTSALFPACVTLMCCSMLPQSNYWCVV